MSVISCCFSWILIGALFVLLIIAQEELDRYFGKRPLKDDKSVIITFTLIAIGIGLPLVIFRALGLDSETNGYGLLMLIVLVNLGIWSLVLLILRLITGKAAFPAVKYSKRNFPFRINIPFQISENVKLIISLIGFISSILGIISFFLDHVFKP